MGWNEENFSFLTDEDVKMLFDSIPNVLQGVQKNFESKFLFYKNTVGSLNIPLEDPLSLSYQFLPSPNTNTNIESNSEENVENLSDLNASISKYVIGEIRLYNFEKYIFSTALVSCINSYVFHVDTFQLCPWMY